MGASHLKILLLSKETRQALKMERLLLTIPGCEVLLESTPSWARRQLVEGKFNCLILNLDDFGFRQFNLVEQIRKLGHTFPILIFADHVQPAATQAVEALHNVVVFSRILVNLDQDFLGLLSRFTKGEKTVKRISKRHPVHQKGLVENTRTGNRFTCVANTLSRGGVSIVFGSGSVQPNDLVKITIQLPKLKKAHLLKGRIVWVRTSTTGALSAGIRFEK